jgi:hypothetical protein
VAPRWLLQVQCPDILYLNPLVWCTMLTSFTATSTSTTLTSAHIYCNPTGLSAICIHALGISSEAPAHFLGRLLRLNSFAPFLTNDRLERSQSCETRDSHLEAPSDLWLLPSRVKRTGVRSPRTCRLGNCTFSHSYRSVSSSRFYKLRCLSALQQVRESWELL